MASSGHNVTSGEQLAARRTAVATIVVLVILLLLFAGLAIVNYIVRQPAAFRGEGEADRNFLFAIYGFEGDLLRRPSNVAVDPQGNIYVADTGKRRIVVFDSEGVFAGAYGNPGRGETDLWNPIDIAVADDGRSYVIDKSQNKLVIFDVTRAPLRAVFFPDEAPLSVEVNGEDLIVTTESGVLIGTLDAEPRTGYVARGKDPGQFDRPAGAAVGSDGTLYIADSLNYRVQAIGTDGQVRWTYGEPIPADEAVRFDDESRLFGLPASVAVDEVGNVYVVDGLNAEIVVLDQLTGQYIETIGDVGHQDGAFYYPDGIAYANGRLVIADKFNDRIQVFRTPTAAAPLARVLPLAPWLLLPLALLALIPLLRRRQVSVVTPAFAEVLVADHERAPQVARALKRVTAAPALVERYGEAVPKLKWIAVEPDTDRVAALAAEHALAPEVAEAFDIALHAKGRITLLSNDTAVNDIAASYELTSVTYDELLESMHLALSDEVADEPLDVEAPATDDSSTDADAGDGEVR